MDAASRRTAIIARHLLQSSTPRHEQTLDSFPCLNYSPPSDQIIFSTDDLRLIMDGHDLEARDWAFRLIEQSSLFCPSRRGGRIFVGPDYNQTKEQQREMTMKRIEFLTKNGVFDCWLTGRGEETELRKMALNEVFGIYDHSLAIKLGVHFFLCFEQSTSTEHPKFEESTSRDGEDMELKKTTQNEGIYDHSVVIKLDFLRGGAIQFFGTKRHHDKWLKDTENYLVKGCFAMTELGHGSNVRGIETIATYDSGTGEFVINTPSESAQKYWIGGAANHATHTIIFSQLYINGTSQGVHAFIAQIRDADGNVCPNVRIADCGHKIGLNGVDNGRIWFDNLRVPRENLLNSVADVLPDGRYVSAIKNPDQRFAAFMAPLTFGRVNIAANAVYISKLGLAIAVRYALTRRAFSVAPNGPEVLLLDYPNHQRRLLPLVAKTCAMSCAANFLKMIFVKRTPETNKTIHVYSSALKATLTWHNMRTLQECREACGGQGFKTENRVGILRGEFDVQSTFEGDNNVLMQQVSKALLAEYIAAQRKKVPFKGLGLEHMNDSCPVIPANPTSCTLRSIKFQTDVFCLRERDLLKRFAAEVSQYQAQGQSKEYAVLLSYQLAEELARAFTERTILQTIIDAEMTSSGPLKDVLGLLRSMYAVISIEEDSSFLQYEHLSPAIFAAARKEVAKLCSDLRPHALGVVSSFGIPDSFLSPIAFDWIEANSWGSPSNYA